MSIRTIDIRFPVGADIGVEQDVIACMVDARIAVASEEEAPVVVKCIGVDDRHRLRAWNGGLVGANMRRNGWQELQGLMRMDWRSEARAICLGMGSTPLFGLGGRETSQATQMVEDSSAHPLLEERVRRVLGALSKSVLVDGQFYAPTKGPTLRVLRHGKEPCMMLTQGFPSYEDEFGVMPFVRTAFDEKDVRERLQDLFVVEGAHHTTVEVIDWKGWGIESIQRESDEAVLLHVMKSLASWREATTLGGFSPAMLASKIEVHDALDGMVPIWNGNVDDASMVRPITAARAFLDRALEHRGRGLEIVRELGMEQADLQRIEGRFMLRTGDLTDFVV